jgi:hypothetical protein
MQKVIVDHQKIKKMYEDGLSAQEISKSLTIPSHQIYGSLKKQNVIRRNAAEQNRLRFEKSPRSYDFKPRLSRSERELMIAALMLYYGEGAKTQNTVDFANSDEYTLALFLKFLRTICRVDENRLKFYLYCFADQDCKGLIRYWSGRLSVNASSFTKPYIRTSNTGLKRLMPHGVLHIRYSDKHLLGLILSLMKEITTELS